MKWRDAVKDPPTVPGFYFVLHPRMAKCVFGWNDGWGVHEPDQWLDESTKESTAQLESVQSAAASLVAFLRREAGQGPDRGVWLKAADVDTGAALAERLAALESLLPAGGEPQ